jgi:hypothetical protein
MELDLGIHIVMHSVFSLKPGVTWLDLRIEQLKNIYGPVMKEHV